MRESLDAPLCSRIEIARILLIRHSNNLPILLISAILLIFNVIIVFILLVLYLLLFIFIIGVL